MTHGQLSLQQLYPGKRGYSIRSLEQFCGENNIHRTARPSSQQLDLAVSRAIEQVSFIISRGEWYARYVSLHVCS